MAHGQSTCWFESLRSKKIEREGRYRRMSTVEALDSKMDRHIQNKRMSIFLKRAR